MAGKLELSVFISSPGDVAEERALAGRVFRRLANEFADVLVLKTFLWEHEPMFAHTGFQEQIPRPSQCDLVVSILWSRLGARLPADFAPAPGLPPPTGTEFEVRDALAAYRKTGRPNLLIYLKRAPPHMDMASAEADELFRQYKRLTEFCRTTFYDAEGAAIVAHHGFIDGADFERQLTEHTRKWILAELDKADERELRPRWTRGSPFRGLQSFDAEHQDVFFGRSQAVGEVIRRLRDAELQERSGEAQAHLLLIIGMSGNGKTSLVRAGLLPFLEDRPVEGIAHWYTLSIRPSDVTNGAAAGVLGHLAARILATLPEAARFGLAAPHLAEVLRAEPAAAAARIETYLAAEAAAHNIPAEQARLLIYIDQLEEIFTVTSIAAQAAALLDAIAALAMLPSVWVVSTLRSDFMHRLESYPAIMELLRRVPPYTLLSPRGDELSDMIRAPAAAAGLEFEERDGVSLEREILRDAAANPESLPLLQYALQQLYDRRRGKTLLWEVYKPAGRAGGLRSSLIEVAEGLVSATGADADAVFRRVMRELTSVSEDGSATRRYALLDGFPIDSPERALIDRLVAARLAVTDRHDTEAVVFLAHEALLQSWPRVVTWLQQESTLLRLRDELQRDAHVWAAHGRSDGWLGITPDKLASLGQLEREGLVPPGIAAEYAQRARRRVGRNRLLKSAAVASIVVLGVMSIIAGVIAMRQRDRALAEATTADRTSQFMVSLFKLADPGENRGKSVTVNEVLERGARDIGRGLEHEPRVRADLLTAMGEAYTGLGLYEPANHLLAQARADQDAISVPTESRVRTLIASAAVLEGLDQLDDARKLLQRALDLSLAQLPADSRLISNARAGLAEVLTQLHRYSEAERLCEAALVVDRKRGPDGYDTLSETLDVLAQARYGAGRLDAAEAPMREALALRTQFFGTRHALTAVSMNNLAGLYYQSGRYAEAEREWQQALPVYREVYGPEHPEVATLLNNLGRSALMAGRVAEAIPLLEQAVQMSEKLQGPTHDELVPPLNSLGMAYMYEGDTTHARLNIDRALQIARLRNHDFLDQVVLNAADVELSLHRIDGAPALLEEAQRLLQARYPLSEDPTAQWRYAVWESVHASLLALQGRPDEARAALSRARGVLTQRFGTQGFYVQRLEQRARSMNLSLAGTASKP